jgi:hypothetical protein
MVKKKLYGYSNLIAMVIGIILCFIAYGPVGILIAIVTQILLGILLLLGFIPIVGVVLYAWLAWYYVLPWIAAFSGAGWEWPLTVMFALNLVVSIGCTLQILIRIFTVWWRF